MANSTFGAAGFADLEIDHVGTNEECHILLYGRLNSSDAELRKFDEDMNLIDLAEYSGSPWPSMTINPNADITTRDIMMPGQSKLGFWFADTYQ